MLGLHLDYVEKVRPRKSHREKRKRKKKEELSRRKGMWRVSHSSWTWAAATAAGHASQTHADSFNQ